MSDIFISYARSTAPQAQRIADALRTLGYGVWRDDELPAHRAYAEVIEERLKAAKAVVVIWSAEAAKSEWVQSEADRARNDRKLVQLSVDGTPLPMPFDRIQCAELAGWTGDLQAPGWRKVVSSIADLIGGAPVQAAAARRPSPVTDDAISIAVLPFVNMSSDPEQEYFSDGLSEELINQLAQIGKLRVAGRTSSFAFKGRTDDFQAIGQKLGVAHVLEGSVRKAGNKLRITAQLIKVSDGYHLWSKSFDRQLDDVFAIQDDIARAVAEALKITLGVGQTALPGGTKNVEAYDYYLRANALMRQRNASAIQRAIALFSEAVTHDPRFAMAWIGLAVGHVNSMIYSPETSAASRIASDEAFERAQACAPHAAMVHAAKANQLNLVQGDFVGAHLAYEKARELAPSNSNVGDTFFLTRVGRLEEALIGYRTLLRIDPLSTGEMLHFALVCAGRYEEAEAEYKRVSALPADPAIGTWFRVLRIMANEGSQTVKLEMKRYLALNDRYLPVLNEVLAKFDDRQTVLAHIRQAFADPFYQDTSHLNGIAYLAAYFGDHELALECLRIAFVEMRGVQSVTIWHPLFAELRKTEGFKQIARDTGLYDYWRKTGHWGDFARPIGDDDFEIIR